mgnify:FL=1
MSNPRITLKGEALQACNRILEETPLENYTEVLKLLTLRYEQDLIKSINELYGISRIPQSQKMDTPHPEVDIPQPQLDIAKPAMDAPQPTQDNAEPKIQPKEPKKAQRGQQLTSESPAKDIKKPSARSALSSLM